MIVPGFLGPTYPSRSMNFRGDRTINWYPEVGPKDGAETSVLALIGTPGLSSPPVSVGSGPIRGMRVFNGDLYVVSGNELYKVTHGWGYTLLGSLSSYVGPVYMRDNGVSDSGVGGDQLAIVDGVNLYLWNISTNVFSTVLPATIGGTPAYLTYLDGYFIVVWKDTLSFSTSAMYDGSTWPGLATSGVSATPDTLVACSSPHQELWLVKNYSTEVWYNTGTATSAGCPFQRISGAVFDFGTPSPASVVVGDNMIFMLANKRVGEEGQFMGAVAFSGYVPVPITPPSLVWYMDQLIKSDAEGYMYSSEGHTFYVLNFPSSNVTLAYDTSTKMWHERSSWTSGPYTINRHRASCSAMFEGGLYVGSSQNGDVYEMASKYGTDNGDPIVSVRITPHLTDKDSMRNIFISKLQVDLESGVGDVSTQDDPVAELSWSNDGGHTWGNPYPASIGKVGEFKKKLRWRRLGWSKDRVFKLVISDPVKKVLLNGYVEGGM